MAEPTNGVLLIKLHYFTFQNPINGRLTDDDCKTVESDGALVEWKPRSALRGAGGGRDDGEDRWRRAEKHKNEIENDSHGPSDDGDAITI